MIHSVPPEFFISGLHRIEAMGGGLARFCCYVNRTDDARLVQDFNLNVLMATEQFPDAIKKMVQFGAYSAASQLQRFLPLHLH